MGLLGAALFLFSHPPMWAPALGVPWWGEPAFVGWDLTRVFWADYAFAQRALSAGELPLWNPYDRAGYPFMAEPQSGAFDPLNWMLVGVALLLGEAPAWLVMLKTVILFGIGSAGLAAYLRNRSLPPWIVVWACTVFVLCPRMDKLKDQSALWPTVWVGWLLFCIDRWLHRPSWKTGAVLGAVTGLIVDSGYPPGAFRLAVLAIPYVVVEGVIVLRRSDDLRGHLRQLVIGAGVGLLVLRALSVGQVVATLQDLPGTIRDAMGEGAVLTSPIAPRHAVGFFAPFTDKAPLYVYASIATVIAALAAWLRPRAHTVLFGALAVLGFSMACGDDLPVLPALVELPGFRSFRIAGHYLVIAVIAFILLGTEGMRVIAEARGRVRWAVLVVVAIEVVAFFSVTDQPSALTIVLVVATCVSLVGVTFAGPRLRRVLVWEVVVLTALDLLVASRPMAEILQPYPDREQARGRALAASIEHGLEHRVADYEWAKRRMGPREGVRDLVGHRPALTDRRYMMLYAAGMQSPRVLAAANVAVVGYDRPYPATRRRDLEPVEGRRRLYRVPEPWPLAFWTDDVTLVDDPKAALRWMRTRRGPGVVFEDEHVEHEQLPPSSDAPRPPVRARVLEQGHNTLILNVEAPAAGVLVVNEGYDPGWVAELDGQPVPVWRANLTFRGIPIPAGEHTVVLAYRPPGVVGLWVLWLLTTLALMGWGGWTLLRRARRPDAGSRG